MMTAPFLFMKKPQFWLLILFLLSGAALRFYRLDHQELRGDEAFSWNYAVNKTGPLHIVDTIIREGDPQPPLHYWLLQSWTRILGDNEWALRSLSATLSVFLIALMYAVGTRWFNARVGLFAAGITVIHPYQIWLAQDVRNMYILATGFSLLALYQLPKLSKTGDRTWWRYVGFSLLGLFSHYYSGFGLAAHLALILLTLNNKARRKAWFTANLVIALVLLPWLLTILPVFLGGQLADPTKISLISYLETALLQFVSGPPTGMWTGLGLFCGWLLLTVNGVQRAAPQHRNKLFMLLPWFGLTLVSVYAVTRARATLNSFYLMVSFPAFYLLVAFGITKLKRPALQWLAASVIVITSGMTLYNHYFVDAWSKTQGLRQVSQIIEAERSPNDIVITNIPDPVQVYYLRNIGIPRSLLPQRDVFTTEQVSATIDNLNPYFDNVWLIPARAAKWDTDGLVENTLNASYLRNADFNFQTARLQRFAIQPAKDPQFIPLNYALEDGVTLTGAYVAVNGIADTEIVSPSQWVRVSLIWEATQPPSTDYQVFVHAKAADGFVVAQHDGVPSQAQRPTTSWEANAQILDVHEFQLPAGLSTPTLEISIGMYDPASGTRLQIEALGTDQVSVKTFTVEQP